MNSSQAHQREGRENSRAEDVAGRNGRPIHNFSGYLYQFGIRDGMDLRHVRTFVAVADPLRVTKRSPRIEYIWSAVPQIVAREECFAAEFGLLVGDSEHDQRKGASALP
jgi:hypothetical protein